MKRFILAILFCFCLLSLAKAQNSQAITELSPITNGVGKFPKKLPKSKIKIDTKIQPLNLSDGKTGVAVTIQTTYSELGFETAGEEIQARVRFYARIYSDDNKINGEFDELETVSLNLADAEKLQKNILSLRKIFELPKGNYQIRIIFRDISTGNMGAKNIKLQIPYSRLTQPSN